MTDKQKDKWYVWLPSLISLFGFLGVISVFIFKMGVFTQKLEQLPEEAYKNDSEIIRMLENSDRYNALKFDALEKTDDQIKKEMENIRQEQKELSRKLNNEMAGYFPNYRTSENHPKIESKNKLLDDRK